MLFIWRGLGILSVVVPFGVALAGELSVDGIMGKGYYSSHTEIPAFSLAIGGQLVWLIGRYANSKERRFRTLPDTGQTVRVQSTHTFFWIPMEWMAIPIVAFAGFMLFK